MPFELIWRPDITAVWPRNLGLEQLNGKTRLTLFGAKRTTYHLFFDCPMTWGYVRGMLGVCPGMPVFARSLGWRLNQQRNTSWEYHRSLCWYSIAGGAPRHLPGRVSEMSRCLPTARSFWGRSIALLGHLHRGNR